MSSKNNIKYKSLINTEIFHKDGSPHIALTAIIDSIENRHSEYNDVAGIIENNNQEECASDYMIELVNKFDQSLIYILQMEHSLQGWLYYKENNKVLNRKVNVYTSNYVNYDIWLESTSSLWNPVDFLLEEPYFDPNIEDSLEEDIKNALRDINDKLSFLCK